MTKPLPPDVPRKKAGRKPTPMEQRRKWTLWEIRQQCRVTLRNCWEWVSQPTTGEHQRRYKTLQHAGKRMSARQVAYLLMYGKLPPAPFMLSAVKCFNPRCINPIHCGPVTESQKCKCGVERGTFRTEEHARAIARGKQEQAGRLPGGMEMARKIRAWKGSSSDFPEPLGISKSLFNRIRRNEAWKEYA